MREALRGTLFGVLIFALLLAAPGTAAAECRFVSAPFPQPWTPDPVFPGCFLVLVGWLFCYVSRGTPTPDDPPDTPAVFEVVETVCYASGGG